MNGMSVMHAVELPFVRALNAVDSAVLGALSAVLSSELLFLAGPLLFLAFFVWRRRGYSLLLTGSSYLLVKALVWGLKFAVGRPRPFLVAADIVDTSAFDPVAFAFPSGVAADMGVCAYLLGIVDPHRRWWYLCAGLLLSFIRVYAGAHWPSDVVAGFLIGYLVMRGTDFLRRRHR